MLHLMNQFQPVSQPHGHGRGGMGRVRLRDSAIGQSLAAAVGPDRTANKDQPYQYSKSSAHPLDDSGWAAAGAGLQKRAG
jgi:hypothetical protein